MFKNTAGQKLTVFAFSTTTNAPVSGDAANITAYVSIDHGSVTALTDTSAAEKDATNAKGYYTFDLTQGETNGDHLHFSAKSSTANVVVIGVPAVVAPYPATGILAPTVAGRTLDVSAGGEAGVDLANVGGQTTTLNLSGTTIKTATDVEADTVDLQSRLPAALVSGRMDASVGAYQSGQAPLQPTVAGRTLDVSAGGEAGVDWANVGGQSTTVNLSATTVGIVASVTALGASVLQLIARMIWPSKAKTVFVSDGAANDSQAGTDPSIAKKTCAGAAAVVSAGDCVVLDPAGSIETVQVAFPAGVKVVGTGRSRINITDIASPSDRVGVKFASNQYYQGVEVYSDPNVGAYRYNMGLFTGDAAATGVVLDHVYSVGDSDALVIFVDGAEVTAIEPIWTAKYDTIRLVGDSKVRVYGGHLKVEGPSALDGGQHARAVSLGDVDAVCELFGTDLSAQGGTVNNNAAETGGGLIRLYGGRARGSSAGAAGAQALRVHTLGTMEEFGLVFDPASVSGTVTHVYGQADARRWAGTTIVATSIPVGTAAGAAGGLVIAGSNAAITFSSLTVSGTTTLTGNVSLGGNLSITGALTAGSNALPWNAAWDAEVQSEAADALSAYGASTHSAADVWAAGTRTLTAGTNIVLPANGLDLIIPAEPGAAPTWGTSTLRQWLAWVGAMFRNKKTQTATTLTLRNIADNGNIATAACSDDGTTLIVGAWS